MQTTAHGKQRAGKLACIEGRLHDRGEQFGTLTEVFYKLESTIFVDTGSMAAGGDIDKRVKSIAI